MTNDIECLKNYLEDFNYPVTKECFNENNVELTIADKFLLSISYEETDEEECSVRYSIKLMEAFDTRETALEFCNKITSEYFAMSPFVSGEDNTVVILDVNRVTSEFEDSCNDIVDDTNISIRNVLECLESFEFEPVNNDKIVNEKIAEEVKVALANNSKDYESKISTMESKYKEELDKKNEELEKQNKELELNLFIIQRNI